MTLQYFRYRCPQRIPHPGQGIADGGVDVVDLLGIVAEIVAPYLVEMREDNTELVTVAASADGAQEFEGSSLHR